MKNFIFILFVSIFIAGCDLENLPQLAAPSSGATVWVFTQFNVPEENDSVDSYWYFGEISQALYERISSNEVHSGFVRLENVHYWGDDDTVYEYADDDEVGELVFRIQDIKKINLLKKAPNVGASQGGEDKNSPDDNT